MPLTVVSLSYLPVAVGLGALHALHALEPGHAKTMTAAYLVGISGRWTDAVLLGLSAALTHSLVMILIAISDRLLRKNTVVRSPVGGQSSPHLRRELEERESPQWRAPQLRP